MTNINILIRKGWAIDIRMQGHMNGVRLIYITAEHDIWGDVVGTSDNLKKTIDQVYKNAIKLEKAGTKVGT